MLIGRCTCEGILSVRQPEPFAAVIYCTSDPEKVDDRTRSKWSRVLRYAAEFKDLDEPLRDFIKRKGGINKCAARFARRLGRCRPLRGTEPNPLTGRWPWRFVSGVRAPS